MKSLDEPIVALATPSGTGGLAVIRISGLDAIEKISPLFRSTSNLSSAESHTIHYGWFCTTSGEKLDEVLVSVFRSPKSYTTQNTIEISCHGSPAIASSIIQACTEVGIRLAEPGEFTKRAFLLGRLDLTQAESVADLIHSTSRIAQQSSLYQLSGSYSEALSKIRQNLIDYISLLELELDFSDEDVEFASREKLEKELHEVLVYIASIRSTFEKGKYIREGIRVVIAGRPNAGKSTLLNQIVGHNRAIVSSIPGTTRDTIEEQVNIQGVPIRLIDTAGIRETVDEIEKIGVDLTHETISRSQVLLYLFDSQLGITEEDEKSILLFREKYPDLKIYLIGNKSDLSEYQVDKVKRPFDFIPISAKINSGVEELMQEIKDHIIGKESLGQLSHSVTNVRHYDALSRAEQGLKKAQHSLKESLSPDLISSDIRYAINSIGEITGVVTTDDILNTIFSRFCIGK